MDSRFIIKIDDLSIKNCGECLLLIPEFSKKADGCSLDRDIEIFDLSVRHKDCPLIRKEREDEKQSK